jgi:hypothetical protein
MGSYFALKVERVRISETSAIQPTSTRVDHQETESIIFISNYLYIVFTTASIMVNGGKLWALAYYFGLCYTEF